MKIKQLKYIITAFLMGLLSVFFGGGICVNAESKSYSNVADDLRKDDNFNAWEYPAKATDYSLQVIQIAESAAGELFVYVYQPSGKVADLRATSVNMSLTEDATATKLYALKYLNSSGVFYKYLAEGVKVGTAGERYYNITSIYREWNADYDKDTGNDNTIDEVVFKVGQLWRAVSVNGKTLYEKIETEVVTVTDKYVGSLRYSNGFLPFIGSVEKCDSHYVAFNCDKDIDKLFEADVTYTTQKYKLKQSLAENLVPIGEPKINYSYLTDKQYLAEIATGGLWGENRQYPRIESVEEFKARESKKLSETAKNNLSGMQWVLHFVETDYLKYMELGATMTEYIEVSEVSILRLKFETAGKVYNLGVVDNKQSGHTNVSGCQTPKWWQLLIFAIICLVVFIVIIKLLIWIVNKVRGE